MTKRNQNPRYLFRLMSLTALCACLALACGGAMAQSCLPASLQSDPSAASAGRTLVRLAGDYKLREKVSRAVTLQEGQSAWFTAAGCPRVDDVELTVTGPDGRVVLSRVGPTTGGCVKALKSGTYRLTVMPRSLRPGYDWGSIAAEGAKSNCVPGDS